MPLKIDHFFVEFHQRFGVYYPGQTVTGDVHLGLDEDFHCDQVEVFFYGGARVFWCSRELKEDQFRNVAYTNEKVYFSDKKPLWTFSKLADNGNQLDTADRPVLKATYYQFPIEFHLPDNLPTSFDARDSAGCVRYWVKVSLKQNGSIKASRKAHFTVVQPRDLNLLEGAGLPVQRHTAMETVDSSPCCLSVKTGRISVTARLYKKGFVPGEPVYLEVSVNNSTNRRLKTLKTTLMQKICSYAESPEPQMKETRNEVVTTVYTANDKGKKKHPTNEPASPLDLQLLLYIPAIVPICEPQLIECDYFLLVDGHFSGGQHVHLTLPICVGTIPLSGMGGNSVDRNHSDPPPSYEESCMGTSATGANDDLNFLPHYVTYAYAR